MRSPDPLAGLDPADRRRIVYEAAEIQQREITNIVTGLFAPATSTAATSRQRAFSSSLRDENTRNPYPSPVDFWEKQEADRRSRTEANRRFGIVSPNAADRPIRPGVGTGLSPVEFARGQRAKPTTQPRIGLPPPPPIRQVSYEAIVKVSAEVTSAVGRIIDVVV